jgi:hypothetical protein
MNEYRLLREIDLPGPVNASGITDGRDETKIPSAEVQSTITQHGQQ